MVKLELSVFCVQACTAFLYSAFLILFLFACERFSGGVQTYSGFRFLWFQTCFRSVKVYIAFLSLFLCIFHFAFVFV